VYIVRDISGHIEVQPGGWASHPSARWQNLQDGRFSKVMLRYRPREDHVTLQFVERNQKQQRESVKERVYLPQIEPAWSI